VRLYDDKICISGAQGADVTGLGAQEFRCRGFALPKSVESGNLSLNKVGIRWMSVQALDEAEMDGYLRNVGLM
jgi:hypothetical protein